MSNQLQKQMKKLSELYGFDVADAESKLKEMSSKKDKEKEEKLEFMLPYCGELQEDKCQAVQPTFGLYLQCPKAITDVHTRLCAACLKKLEKNGTGAPDNGWMEDRQKAGLYEFKTPTGKKAIHYLKVVEKRGWDLDTIKEYISSKSLAIPAEHFAEVKAAVKAKAAPKAKASTGKIEKLTIENLQEHQAKAEELSENEYDGEVSGVKAIEKTVAKAPKKIDDEVTTVAESVQSKAPKAKGKAKAIEKPVAEVPKVKAKAKAKAIEKPKAKKEEKEEEEIKCIEYVVDGVTMYLHEATGILYDEEGNEMGKK